MLANRRRADRAYEQSGVREYWVVDPAERIVTVFRSERRRFDAGTAVASGTLSTPLLPAPEIPVDELSAG